MATISLPPEYIIVPDSDPVDTYPQRVEAYQQSVANYCKENGQSPYGGAKIKFPVDDGLAIYYVFSLEPAVLIHDGSGDEYPYASRLTMVDIKQEIDSVDVWDTLLGE